VGGFLGLFTSRSITYIKFEKNEYLMGESILVQVTVDNTNCRKKVKKLKLVLVSTLKASGHSRELDFTAPRS